ncbi:MAG: hypothetical protein P8R31_19640 [Mariniblastus sp.]|nr:hypothetical protein [Mariniblastus sp.]MDG2012687.1 hypothetical protein [Pirellulaceae bacterium]
MRTSVQVAERALVMGAVTLRSSLEITDHPRSAEMISRIPSWLEELGLAEGVDSLERAILWAPPGQLERDQLAAANWAGEGAAFFCWALGLGEQPLWFQQADQQTVIDTLRVMRPEAGEHLRDPALRCIEELQGFCKQVLLIRLEFLPEIARPLKRKMLQRELAGYGIEVGNVDVEEVSRLVGGMAAEQLRSLYAPYLARDVAASWLLSSRSSYFSVD